MLHLRVDWQRGFLVGGTRNPRTLAPTVCVLCAFPQSTSSRSAAAPGEGAGHQHALWTAYPAFPGRCIAVLPSAASVPPGRVAGLRRIPPGGELAAVLWWSVESRTPVRFATRRTDIRQNRQLPAALRSMVHFTSPVSAARAISTASNPRPSTRCPSLPS